MLALAPAGLPAARPGLPWRPGLPDQLPVLLLRYVLSAAGVGTLSAAIAFPAAAVGARGVGGIGDVGGGGGGGGGGIAVAVAALDARVPVRTGSRRIVRGRRWKQRRAGDAALRRGRRRV